MAVLHAVPMTSVWVSNPSTSRRERQGTRRPVAATIRQQPWTSSRSFGPSQMRSPDPATERARHDVGLSGRALFQGLHGLGRTLGTLRCEIPASMRSDEVHNQGCQGWDEVRDLRFQRSLGPDLWAGPHCGQGRGSPHVAMREPREPMLDLLHGTQGQIPEVLSAPRVSV